MLDKLNYINYDINLYVAYLQFYLMQHKFNLYIKILLLSTLKMHNKVELDLNVYFNRHVI